MIEDNLTVNRIREKFPGSIIDVTSFRGEVTLVVRKEDILKIAGFLHDDPELSYDFLTDLCGVDYLNREPRFEVVYHLYSIKNCNRVRIKVQLPTGQEIISSVTSVWKTADWHERECYDLLGIKFENHPDLRRILLSDEWEGHPLRKDYPLRGG